MPRKHTKSAKLPECTTTRLLDDFKRGDILFGLTSKREKYFEKLDNEQHQYYSANHLNIPLVSELLQGELDNEKIKTLPDEQKNHARLLLKHSEVLTKNGGKDPWNKEKIEQKLRAIAIRRACKLLVKTAKENTGIGSIRFLLDGIDMKRVCSRKTTDGKLDTSITSGELRAAYRTRSQNNGAVFFYNKGLQVCAPWEQEAYKQHWLEYEKSCAEKKRTVKK